MKGNIDIPLFIEVEYKEQGDNAMLEVKYDVTDIEEIISKQIKKQLFNQK